MNEFIPPLEITIDKKNRPPLLSVPATALLLFTAACSVQFNGYDTMSEKEWWARKLSISNEVVDVLYDPAREETVFAGRGMGLAAFGSDRRRMWSTGGEDVVAMAAGDGSYTMLSNTGGDFALTQFSATGEWLKTTPYGSDSWQYAEALAADTDGSLFVAGATSGSLEGIDAAGKEDAFVMKITPQGSVEWTRLFGRGGWQAALAVTVYRGMVYVTGNTAGDEGAESSPDSNCFLVQLDLDGNLQYTRNAGSDRYDSCSSLAVDEQGVYVHGSTEGLVGSKYAGQADVYIWGLDHDGTTLFVKQAGSAGTDLAGGLLLYGEKIYLFGRTNGDWFGSSAGSFDLYTMVLSRSGELLEGIQFGTVLSDFYAGGAVIQGDLDRLYIPGFSEGAFNAPCAMSLHYDSTGGEYDDGELICPEGLLWDKYTEIYRRSGTLEGVGI